MKRSRSIRIEIGMLFLLLGVVPVLVISLVVNTVISRIVVSQSQSVIDSVADSAVASLDEYVSGLIADANVLSRMPAWPLALRSGEAIIEPETEFREFLYSFYSDKQYADLLVLDERGTVRFSIRQRKDLGENLHGALLRESVLPETILAANTLLQTEVSAFRYYSPAERNVAFLAAPIFDQGALVGNVVLQVDESTLLNVLDRHLGFGEQTEIVIAASAGRFMMMQSLVSGERMSPEYVLIDYGNPLWRAVQGEAGAGIYTDHEAHDALASWRYIPSMNWGLLVKIDMNEVQKPIARVNSITMGLIVLTIAVVFFGVCLAHVRFVSPLMNLAKAVRGIRKDELPSSLELGGVQEIGEVESSFNLLLGRVRAYQHNLEAEVKERTRELRHALDVARSANQAKSQFLANVSHEIRTPLNGIIGFAELLSENVSEQSQRNQAELIARGGRDLLKLIDTILDLSRIETGQLTLHRAPSHLIKLCHDIESVFAPAALRKNLSFRFLIEPDTPLQWMIDEWRVRQILFALIDNAIKFSTQGHVEVIIRAQKPSSRNSIPDGVKPTLASESPPVVYDLAIHVVDTGRGIPGNFKSELFEAFAQPLGQDHAFYGGLGLGLAIAKQLARLMNGDLKLSDGPNGIGTEAVLILRTVSLPNVGVEYVDRMGLAWEAREGTQSETSSEGRFLSGQKSAGPTSQLRADQLRTDVSAEVQQEIQTACRSLQMKRIEMVAVRLQEEGSAAGNPILIQVGDELLQAVKTFQIAAIQDIMTRLKEMLQTDDALSEKRDVSE